MAIRNIDNQRIDVNDDTGYISVDVRSTIGLTDAELRATPVPVSGDVNATITEGQVSDGGGSGGLNPVFVAGMHRGSSTIYTMAVDTDGHPQVDVLTLPAITATDLDIRDLTFATDKVDVSGSTGVGVTGTFWQATQPVSLASTAITNTGFVRNPYSTINDGRKTVATAGSREALASTTACKEVTITALDTNTDVVVIGGTTVVASAGTRRGTPLMPSQAVTISIDDLNKINLDSVVSGEGVSFTYHT